MPTKRSDEPQSVNRRRFLGASVSTAALPFVGTGLNEAVAQPVALAHSDTPVSVALSINGEDYQLGLSRLLLARQQMLAVIRCIARSDDSRGAEHDGQVFVGGERGAKSGVAAPRGIA